MATDRHFTETRAEDELAKYRRRGPTGTARLMLDALRELALPLDTLLDIGAGVGVLHHELLGHGVERAIHVEAAAAYVHAAQEESERRGQGSRIRFIHGDFVSLAPTLPAADLVTLDRVVCCHPDLEPLMRQSADKAQRYYALSFPPIAGTCGHTWWQNERRRQTENPFRTFIHPAARIRSLLREGGFQIRRSRRTPAWQVLVCARPGVS